MVEMFDLDMVYVVVGGLVIIALGIILSQQKSKVKKKLVDKKNEPTPYPIHRWESAPSLWARFTFLKEKDIPEIASYLNVDESIVRQTFKAYNEDLKLPGRYDTITNVYEYKTPEGWVKDKPLSPGAGLADEYILEKFPSFRVYNA